jgi:flagellar hook assembly protein FlgD
MSLPRDAEVTLSIYDVRGHRVKTVVNEALPAGIRTLVWDGTNDWGQQVSSGVYFYRAVAGEEVITQRMMVIK